MEQASTKQTVVLSLGVDVGVVLRSNIIPDTKSLAACLLMVDQ